MCKVNIELLMQQDAIRVNYQPIVSIRARRIVGYESLARAVDSDGAPIAANDLFSSAREQGQLLELDRYCRLLGLREFRKQQSADGCVLFLNVNASLINASTRNSGALKSAIEETGIDPPHVAIELVESRVDSPEVLLDFVDTYRKYGCLIVLDDFGTAHSNLERLMLVRPDVIKIDRSIINRVAEDPYGKMVVSSIVALSHTVGALCLAEGVETFEQMLVCAQLGVDLFQGYVMSRPAADIGRISALTTDLMSTMYPVVQDRLVTYAEERYSLFKGYRKITSCMMKRVSPLRTIDEIAAEMRALLPSFPSVECLYLLDSQGLQVTDTITRERDAGSREHFLFRPAPRGTDHSLKSYFYMLSHRGEFVTDQYVSLATGNMCRTLATRIATGTGEDLILCVDFEGMK